MHNRPCSLFVNYASAFPVIFIDQFGVLHDGCQPYPGAIEALRALKARGACVIIFSNSGRPGTTNALRMAELGFPPDLYDYFVTSGDAAKSALALGENAGNAQSGDAVHDNFRAEGARFGR
jgi:ribonucleotide monophosphatase NagD (HAD superfamily)